MAGGGPKSCELGTEEKGKCEYPAQQKTWPNTFILAAKSSGILPGEGVNSTGIWVWLLGMEIIQVLGSHD
mgnify:CR=1 FL=1